MPVPSEPCRECGAIDEVSELIALLSPNGEDLAAIFHVAQGGGYWRVSWCLLQAFG